MAKRCAHPSCSIKLNLVEKSMVCRCDKSYCSKHRLPESHHCSGFDEMIKESKHYLSKSLPAITTDKINKI